MKKIRALVPEMGEKAFEEKELKALEDMHVDYIASLLEDPAELKRALQKYQIAKRAADFEMVAEVYSPPPSH